MEKLKEKVNTSFDELNAAIKQRVAVLKSSKHEEQSYNACAGILHLVKDLPHGLAEETYRKCIQMNSCRYFTFK